MTEHEARTGDKTMHGIATLTYRTLGVVLLVFFPMVVFIAWLNEKVLGLGDTDETLAGAVRQVWDTWRHEFWRPVA